LIVVSAVFNEDLGDYESTKTISAITADHVKIAFAGQQVRKSRAVRRADLESARVLRASFNEDDDEMYAGTTAISTSAAVLRDLVTKGQADFGVRVDDSDASRGTIKRVAGPATMSVIVNDIRTELPVVRARGSLEGDDASVVFLDDPTNPLVLQFRFQDRKLDVIRIAFPTDKPRIESELATTKRAVVYGIYFDFGSDRIRPESQPVLREIAEALRKNPDWTLSVEGHTDNIGGDSDNLELSERRAAAVKGALSRQFGIAGNRLTTAGYGESRPVDTNETLQGRARNRRVELVRQ
jgi:hypothetical protein